MPNPAPMNPDDDAIAAGCLAAAAVLALLLLGFAATACATFVIVEWMPL